MESWIGPNGNGVEVSENNNINIFNVILKISKIALIFVGIVLFVLYYIFYFKSGVPDLIHILISSEDIFNKCYNLSIISDNLKEIYIAIVDYINSVPRY